MRSMEAPLPDEIVAIDRIESLEARFDDGLGWELWHARGYLREHCDPSGSPRSRRLGDRRLTRDPRARHDRRQRHERLAGDGHGRAAALLRRVGGAAIRERGAGRSARRAVDRTGHDRRGSGRAARSDRRPGAPHDGKRRRGRSATPAWHHRTRTHDPPRPRGGSGLVGSDAGDSRSPRPLGPRRLLVAITMSEDRPVRRRWPRSSLASRSSRAGPSPRRARSIRPAPHRPQERPFEGSRLLPCTQRARGGARPPQSLLDAVRDVIRLTGPRKDATSEFGAA